MRKIVSYLLLISWLILIFILSNQNGTISSHNSITPLYNIADMLNINYNFIDSIHGIIRELMHSFEYLILGVLVVNLLKQYSLNNIVITSLLLCFIYSVGDEIHQVFVPGRTFEYIDLFMDFIGYLLGTVLSNKIIKNRGNV